MDADTLARRDVKNLWKMDLQGHPLAGAPDVGYAIGHTENEIVPYFYYGLSLLDLAKIRAEWGVLESRAKEMEAKTFHDQVMVNVHFRGRWRALSLRWHAQGPGTYAALRSSDHERIDMKEMKEPCVVHFTRPVDLDLPAVLSPWAQPSTSKPWGYAGAPDHPYAADGGLWWKGRQGADTTRQTTFRRAGRRKQRQ